MGQAPSLVPIALLAPISFDSTRMSSAILSPVIGMARPPLARTIEAYLPIFGVGLNSLAMVFRTAMALAIGLATNSLLRPVGGGLKQLLTVAAAANGRQGPALLRLPLSKLLHLLNPFRVCFRVRTAFPDGGFKTMAFSLARMTYFLPGTDSLGPGMLRFIEADLSATRQADHGDGAPALCGYAFTLDSFCPQTRYLTSQIGAHQVKLVSIVFLSRMDSRFGGRKLENQPTVARIHRSKAQDGP
jgi:hypothetical protein